MQTHVTILLSRTACSVREKIRYSGPPSCTMQYYSLPQEPVPGPKSIPTSTAGGGPCASQSRFGTFKICKAPLASRPLIHSYAERHRHRALAVLHPPTGKSKVSPGNEASAIMSDSRINIQMNGNGADSHKCELLRASFARHPPHQQAC